MTTQKLAKTHNDLDVYKRAFDAASCVFEISGRFPKEEKYSLTDQVRRSSRSLCANIAEAWRKRRYPNAFVAKLSDAESEAAETQVWLEFAVHNQYIDEEEARELYRTYNGIIATIVGMIHHQDSWTTLREDAALYNPDRGLEDETRESAA